MAYALLLKFQKKMQKILRIVDDIVCQMDDILVHGSDVKQHNRRPREVLSKLQQTVVTLNDTKCEFNKKTVKPLGHIINETDIQANPYKTRAILNFPTPTNRTELSRFFGIINYLGKFSPRLDTETNHLRQLLGIDSNWGGRGAFNRPGSLESLSFYLSIDSIQRGSRDYEKR